MSKSRSSGLGKNLRPLTIVSPSLPALISIGIITIDGAEVWRQTYTGRDRSSYDCSVETHYEDIDVILYAHASDTAKIRVTSTLDQVCVYAGRHNHTLSISVVPLAAT